jgi:hypothetical protein
MWEWYWIGLAAGLGVGVGVLLAGVLGPTRAGIWGTAALAAVAGAGIGFAVQNWKGALAGAIGGAAGAAGASPVVRGALERGGTRGGTAILMGVAGLALAALALVPVVGFLEVLAVPLLGSRLRRSESGRYAGLRILARD